jgi:hypothetical protein
VGGQQLPSIDRSARFSAPVTANRQTTLTSTHQRAYRHQTRRRGGFPLLWTAVPHRRHSGRGCRIAAARYDALRNAAARRQGDAEARAAEWAAEPSLDAARSESSSGFRLRPIATGWSGAGRASEFTLISPSEQPARLGRTEHQTFLKVPLWSAVPILPLEVAVAP